MNTARLLESRIVSFVLPPICLGCDRLAPDRRLEMGLCVRCRGRLRPLTGPGCWRCARPLAGAALPRGFRCETCRLRPPAFDRLVALWTYAPPFDGVIRAFKFGRLEFLGRQLAPAFRARFAVEGLQADLVTPVPLHWSRFWRRGYNQAERIARPLAKSLGLPFRATLRKARRTPPQNRLPRERRITNLEGAFRPRRPSAWAGRRVLLIDDVVTTGATLQAAAECLKKAGATGVVAMVAGRTPGPGEILSGASAARPP
jgi:ComF family protein